VEFRYIHQLKTTNSIKDLDVAFVEGAVSSGKQASQLKNIRANSKYVVAIGSCACTGLPSATKNSFTDDMITERIQWYLDHFDYAKNVLKLDEVITVDDQVSGCPMSVPLFIEVLTKYLKIYNLIS